MVTPLQQEIAARNAALIKAANNNTTNPPPPTNTQLTSFSLNPATWIQDLFNSAGFRDTMQRVGLVIFGGALIIVGIIMLAGKQTISLVLPETRAAAAGGPVGSTTRRSEIHHYKHNVSDSGGDEE